MSIVDEFKAEVEQLNSAGVMIYKTYRFMRRNKLGFLNNAVIGFVLVWLIVTNSHRHH